MPTASKLKTDESGRSLERLAALPERDRDAASGRIPVDLFAPVTSKLLAEARCHQQHATETVPASTAPVQGHLPGCGRAQPTCGSKETAMKGAAASPRARPTEHRINESQSATSGTKLARWVSRAEGKVVSAPKAVVSAPKSALAPNAEQRWLEQKEQAAREAHQLLYRTPTHGSAMEAWMARMSAKQAHLPWPDKFRDPCDEERKLREGSLTAIDILKQRNHLNPPDAQRSYSSIRATEDPPDYPQPRLKVETSSPPFHEETIDCMALSVGNGLVVDKAADGSSVVRGNYPNVPQNNRVTAKLVFARPKFGDMPLCCLLYTSDAADE